MRAIRLQKKSKWRDLTALSTSRSSIALRPGLRRRRTRAGINGSILMLPNELLPRQVGSLPNQPRRRPLPHAATFILAQPKSLERPDNLIDLMRKEATCQQVTRDRRHKASEVQ
jgi:hypothetical protein